MNIKGVFIVCSFFILFLAYSFLAFNASEKFISPDETANFYFTKHFAETGSLKVPEPLESVAPIVAPRSVGVQNDALVPGSFLGMPLLYGALGNVFGSWVILFLTPLISVFAVFVFYYFVRLFFERDVALFSSILMALHPAFWYYSARGMMHNALFVDLLIFGFYFVAKILLNKTTSYRIRATSYFFAGLFIGGAIAVRTSEVVWVGALLIMLGIIFWRRIDWRLSIWMAIVAMMLPMIPILTQNNQLYGSPLTFSYTVGGAENAEVATESAKNTNNILSTFGQLLSKATFPFGIHWDNIAGNLWKYGVGIVWPFALLTLFGCIVFFKKILFNFFASFYSSVLRSSEKRVIVVYFVCYLFLSTYLILYYGSWAIYDNPLKPFAVTMEQSYLRYWLPLYIFGLPFAAWLIIVLFTKVRERLGANLFAGSAVLLVFNFSFSSVISEPLVGLATIRKNTVEYKAVAEMAKRFIEPNAVILSGKADKVFFPEFSVIALAIDTKAEADKLKKILREVPVYMYLLDFSGTDEEALMLEKFGLELGKETPVSEDAALYRVTVN
ncbi:MAG TPA: glycosyltransferase family 39 protein [Patescibacteria group bacterium]|nr:glycosyltransferase family 39 protein [Patescibacteria group bacterium]